MHFAETFVPPSLRIFWWVRHLLQLPTLAARIQGCLANRLTHVLGDMKTACQGGLLSITLLNRCCLETNSIEPVGDDRGGMSIDVRTYIVGIKHHRVHSLGTPEFSSSLLRTDQMHLSYDFASSFSVDIHMLMLLSESKPMCTRVDFRLWSLTRVFCSLVDSLLECIPVEVCVGWWIDWIPLWDPQQRQRAAGGFSRPSLASMYVNWIILPVT